MPLEELRARVLKEITESLTCPTRTISEEQYQILQAQYQYWRDAEPISLQTLKNYHDKVKE